MPELPECERGRTLAEVLAKGRAITDVTCTRDEIVFDNVGPKAFHNALLGRTVKAVRRRGKVIWFELSGDGPHPLFHFGMTGQFRTRDHAPIKYRSSPKQGENANEWPPKWTKIHLTFGNDAELVMTNKRRLGRVLLRDDPEHEPPISELGFDPLIDLPSPTDFHEMLQQRNTMIKALLMDQSFSAGIGNWMADEILYQAKIDPRRRTNELDEDDARRIRNKMKHVAERAVEAHAHTADYPRTWLFHQRWEKNNDATTARGEKIEHIKVGGRTTAWVPLAEK